MREYVAPHITLDHSGIAYLDQTQTKVLSVVGNKKASGDTPEQLRDNLPHLTLVQVYAAMTYYLDHQAEIDAQVAEMDRQVEEILAKLPPGPTRKELLARRRARSRVVTVG